MAISKEVRRLQAKWQQNTGWPKRLEWIEIDGLRGWTGQRVPLNFPIVALTGENGSGKSTVIQAAASVYSSDEAWFASDFFPNTPWEQITDADIRFGVREGEHSEIDSIRKPGTRWRGNPERHKRAVTYIDLSRIQPVAARMGYSRLAKEATKEASAVAFEKTRLGRFIQIMGRNYDSARMSLTDFDSKRQVSVVSHNGVVYSGFHQGGGETMMAELLSVDPEQYSLVLIDEIETSLHPRAQRRLIRDLAEICRERELQIIITTHSPYILSELPLEARIHIMQTTAGRSIVTGVSPEFAMTKMDDYPYPECEVYVEDEHAQTMLREIIVARSKNLVERCLIIPYGASNVGRILGQMALQNRFPRATCVFLDGDQSEAPGCWLLPGNDTPERVVFSELQKANWGKVAERTGRDFSDVADACMQAMALTDCHDWVKSAASKLVLAGDILWQAMCAEWALNCLDAAEAKKVIQPISDLLLAQPKVFSSSTVQLPLLPRSPADALD